MTDTARDRSAEARIRAQGCVTFAAFMDEALYGPGGYYTSRARLGGADADFYTSPELHPAFGASIGRFAARIWAALGRPDHFDVVEGGPGTGALCRDLLTWAESDHPQFAATIGYRLVETSPALREVQRDTLAAAGVPTDRVAWSTELGSKPIEGLILAHELIDAFPVHVVAVRSGRLLERYVTLDHDDRLAWIEDEPSTPEIAAYFEWLGLMPGEGCIAEVNLAGPAWMERAGGQLRRGAALVFDYGYPAETLYHARRRHGTLLTYRNHALGSDPLVRVGAQDITTHVDFTSLARAGERAGLATLGLIAQATLLPRLGLQHYLGALDATRISAGEHDQNRRAMLALIDPSGPGRVEALVQTRDLDGFDPFDASSDPPARYLPLLRPGQMRLPGPLEAEGFVDLDKQWRELFGDAPDT